MRIPNVKLLIIVTLTIGFLSFGFAFGEGETNIEEFLPDENLQEIINEIKTNPELKAKLLEAIKDDENNENSSDSISREITNYFKIPRISTPSVIEQMFAKQFSIEVPRDITQFGYNIFDTPSTFTPSELAPVPAEYVIGPDDELIINIWGKIQETFKVRVDRDGKIVLPKAGVVYVWGVKFSELEALIHKQMEQYYTNLQLSVTMGKLRNIRVFVLGEVRKPGAYTISGISTAFNALFSAEGLTKLGSMRNIKIITGGKDRKLDLYEILLYGNKKGDYFLNSGDIVYVPPIGKVAGISGSVKKPGIYELDGTETLKDLVKIAGDVTPIGYLKKVQIERIEAHERKIVTEFEFDKGTEFILKDGDFVFISPILPQKHNYVTISGNVFRPGEYALKPNLMVKDLIENADGIKPGTYFDRAEISRFKNDKTYEVIPINLKLVMQGDSSHNLVLNDWDKVKVYAITDIFPPQYVRIDGAVKSPGRYELTPNMTVQDLIFRAGGYLLNAELERAEFCRTLQGELPKTTSIDLRDNRVLSNKLMPQDWLFVRENTEKSGLSKIKITGEVLYPGIYTIYKGEKLGSVIKRAGGFTDRAFLPGVVFTRENVKQQESKAIRDFILTGRKKLLQEKISLKAANLNENEYKEQLELIKYQESVMDLVSKTEVPGRIQIDLSTPKSLGLEIVLENKDSLDIPVTPSAVKVVGCVYNPSAIIYKKGKSMGWYIKQVGGVTPEGDKKRIYVLKASGRVDIKDSKMETGDIIVVPEKFELRRPKGDIIKDVAQVLYQLGFSAVAMYTLYKAF